MPTDVYDKLRKMEETLGKLDSAARMLREAHGDLDATKATFSSMRDALQSGSKAMTETAESAKALVESVRIGQEELNGELQKGVAKMLQSVRDSGKKLTDASAALKDRVDVEVEENERRFRGLTDDALQELHESCAKVLLEYAEAVKISQESQNQSLTDLEALKRKIEEELGRGLQQFEASVSQSLKDFEAFCRQASSDYAERFQKAMEEGQKTAAASQKALAAQCAEGLSGMMKETGEAIARLGEFVESTEKISAAASSLGAQIEGMVKEGGKEIRDAGAAVLRELRASSSQLLSEYEKAEKSAQELVQDSLVKAEKLKQMTAEALEAGARKMEVSMKEAVKKRVPRLQRSFGRRWKRRGRRLVPP